jgi:hypothetical protein
VERIACRGISARCGGKVRGTAQIGCPSEGISEVVGAGKLFLSDRSGTAAAAEKLCVVRRECLPVLGGPFAFRLGIVERIGRFGGRRRFFGVCHGDSSRNRRRR